MAENELHDDVGQEAVRAQRLQFIEMMDLVDLLEDCVIDADYSIPDELNAALKFSEAGERLGQKLITQERVHPKEAHLICLLEVGREELFLDVHRTDLEKARAAISAQVNAGEIRFAMRFGRTTYDAYAALFPDARRSLTTADTAKLMERTGPGVGQYGRWLVGPLGLLRSDEARYIPASRHVPAYHCHDANCRQVHGVLLETSQEAAINRAREAIRKVLPEEGQQKDSWWRRLDDYRQGKATYFAGHSHGLTVTVLGDCLSDDELRRFAGRVLDGDGGKTRANLQAHGVEVRGATEATNQWDRATLLQVCLLGEEDTLRKTLDEAVFGGDIIVPGGEVRIPPMNANMRTGAFQIAPELGHRGVRFVSTDRGYAFLRLRNLVHRLYDLSRPEDVGELEWQLRSVPGDDVELRLDDYLRTAAPDEIVKRLVLARKSNVLQSLAEVDLDMDVPDEDAVTSDLVLWRLGFDSARGSDPDGDLMKYHARVKNLVQSWSSSGLASLEDFRAAASNYFAELEGCLARSLGYLAWSLSTDHFLSRRPFVFYPDTDVETALAALSDYVVSNDKYDRPLDLGREALTLSTLIDAFGLMSEWLADFLQQRADFLRPISDLPDFAGNTDFKHFPFMSTVPFLDLTQSSQDRLLVTCREVSAVLRAGDVAKVRNSYAHYRRTAPDTSKMIDAIDAVEKAMRLLREIGALPGEYAPVSRAADAWERRQYTFEHPRYGTQLVDRPSRLDWLPLPRLSSKQLIFHGARLPGGSECLRFAIGYATDFARMWEDFPVRRVRPAKAGAVGTSEVSA